MKHAFDSIESVVADLRKGKMVIVVDDASPDQTARVLVAAASSDSRIEIVFSTGERRVRLLRGEAHFAVASNPATLSGISTHHQVPGFAPVPIHAS